MKITNLDELRFIYSEIRNVIKSVFAGVVIQNENKGDILVIKEKDEKREKERYRFPGGGVDEFNPENPNATIEGFLETAKIGAIREVFQKTSLEIDKNKLEFICALIVPDQDEPKKHHIKVFFLYKTGSKFIPLTNRLNNENEVMMDYKWTQVTIEPKESNYFISFNPSIPVTKSHCEAVLTLKGVEN